MRQDYRVYNEATGFSLHSRHLGGRSRREVAADLGRSVHEGLIVPMALDSDCSLVVRVVAGVELNAQERDEWVGRASWWLDLRDGTLVVEGGFDDRKNADEAAERAVEVAVPPGHYAIDVYAYINGTNGDRCVTNAGLEGSPLDWFRRSHTGREIPFWFAERFEDWIDADDEFIDDPTDPELVDYVVHMQTLEGGPPDEVPELRRGWFPPDAGARVPERCPLGIIAGLPEDRGQT